MTPEIRSVNSKKILGFRIRTNLADQQTFNLWSRFMPRLREIGNRVNNELLSVEIYDSASYFSNFDPSVTFDKWAAAEVSDFSRIPENMEPLEIPTGLYAVFIHRGPTHRGHETFRYIFGTWLPSSAYETDDRPHFEIMGEQYRHDSPESEEEFWIPVKPKS